MPRKSGKNSEPEWQMALCTVCLFRQIKKRSSTTTFEEMMSIAKKNEWQWYYDKLSKTITFICPECAKQGYAFED